MIIRKLHVSAAAIAIVLGASLAVTPAFAQAPPERPASPVAVKPGEVSAEEMARRWGGDTKSGITTAGPEVDKTAINAPMVQPGYKLPRLADGHPDMTGTWSNASNTAMRRPGNTKNLVMTDDEWVKARANNPQNIRQATDDKQNSPTPRTTARTSSPAAATTRSGSIRATTMRW